jgi:hypothetical protein
MYGRTMAASLMTVLLASHASAETTASSRVLDSFARCRTIAAAQQRADCFDAAARDLENSVKTRNVTIVDREEVRTARRSLFGFTLPRIGLFDGADRDEKSAGAPDEIKEIESTIASARSTANGRVELRLTDSEAVWSTTDPMPFPPKPGTKVRIRRGALGNYFIAVSGQRSVRGMRLR